MKEAGPPVTIIMKSVDPSQSQSLHYCELDAGFGAVDADRDCIVGFCGSGLCGFDGQLSGVLSYPGINRGKSGPSDRSEMMGCYQGGQG